MRRALAVLLLGIILSSLTGCNEASGGTGGGGCSKTGGGGRSQSYNCGTGRYNAVIVALVVATAAAVLPPKNRHASVMRYWI
jgi:hypothetical protein